jgi:putative hydrolase of the HAD superfamily
MIEIIAFDADDTLWQNETLYTEAQNKFKKLLAPYYDRETVTKKLYEIEMRNLPVFGYGIKGFTFSMIETAIELTEGQISGGEIQTILDTARWMVQSEVQLLEHVEYVLHELAETHTLMLITKGDLLDQEGKISRSGLAHLFEKVEIVSDKTPKSYARIFDRHNILPERFLMVGNSMRSDILPVLSLGSKAVYIPHPLTWTHEQASPIEAGKDGYFELENISQLPELIKRFKTR